MSPSTLRPRVVSLLAALLVGLLGVVVLPPLAQAATVEVRITSTLEPATVTVTPGTTVTWVNADGERHRIRSTGGPEDVDSGNLDPGERFSHTFTALGTISYVDDRAPDATAYHGSITVADGVEPPPDTTPPPDGPETVTVSMVGRRFTPSTLSITTGDTVRFLNDDDRDHTATADDGSFDSGILVGGQAWERTFTTAGTFSYLCLLHPDMVGTVAVADPGGTAPPPAPPPSPTPDPAPTSSPTAPPVANGDSPAAPSRVEVELRDFSFAPATLEVAVGSTVVFRNTGRALHTATADDGSFDSDLVAPGGASEHRLDRVGTFAYTCLLHPEMTGTITVVSGGTSPGSDVTAEPDPPASQPDTEPDAAPPPRPRGSVLVSLRDFSFAPSVLDLQVGDTVRFRNDGQALHTATARDGSHDTGLLRPGEAADHTFSSAGTFAYWCTLHPDMVATIRVAGSDGGVPAAAPRPEEDGDDGDEPGAGRSSTQVDDGPVTVSVVDDDFLPGVLEVVVGQEVVWTNEGRAVHTVTADDGSFDSGIIAAGGDFRHRFETLGTVAYTCIVHPGMAGEVRVVAAADDAVGAAPAAATDGGPSAPGAATGRLSTAALEVLLLGVFAAALALFTAVARHVGGRGSAAG